MNPAFKEIFPKNIVAFMSDSSMDFKLAEGQTELTQKQKTYLNKELGLELPDVINIQQVHGKEIVVIKDEAPIDYQMQEADGIITNVANVPIAIRTADCVPVLMCDPVAGCIGVIHAGWKSTHQRIVQEAVSVMREEFGSKTANIIVSIGPCIRLAAFEVGVEFLMYFPDETVEKDGKLYCDVALANRSQLRNVGIKKDHIFDCNECTVTDKKYFSFRRDADTSGRMIHLMMIKD